MKRLTIILAASLAVAGVADAQTLHVENGSVAYSFPASAAGDMVFGTSEASATLTVLGREMALTPSTSMWVDDAEVEDNTVTVTYDGPSARVDIAGNIARYVDASVTGAHVSVIQSPDVGEGTCGEITYRLSGSSAVGSFVLEGSFKTTVELADLNLHNPDGAAIDIQNGKRISLNMTPGTASRLSDGASGTQKGCVVCKGHLELGGNGSLTVSGNASHAIYAKEYVEIKDCSISVESAVKDGVNCGQHLLIESGSLEIGGTGDDGIQVSYKDDADREAEDTGAVTVTGGMVNISVSADASKGIKCEGPMHISGGGLTVTVSGDGVWDSDKNKTKASACLASDGDMDISGGMLLLTATGGGGKGINCDGRLSVGGGEMEIRTSGGIVAYVNGTLHTDYRGDTDRLDSDMKSSPKGIKADGDIEINGGEINVTTTGNGAEGIESKSTLTINGGDIEVYSTDDAINSSSHLYIKGGDITVVASGNDGLDSNGNLYIQGGRVMALGTRMPECGIDANEEEGYTVVFTGGTLLAVGGGNSVPSPTSGSTQPYVSGTGNVSAGSEITLSDSEGAVLASFTVPSGYVSSGNQGGGGPGGFGGNGSSVLVTCPGLSVGTSYTLKLGESGRSVTARLTGNSGGGPGGRP